MHLMFQTISRWSHNLIQLVWWYLRPHLIFYLRFYLQNILLESVKPSKKIKEEFCYAWPTLTQRSDYRLQFSNTQALKRWLSAWRKDAHLMLALNAPNDHFHQTKIKWRYLLVVRQQILKDETYINQKLWRLKI